MLMDLTAEFVKKLNSIVQELDMENEEHASFVEVLRLRISEIISLCKNAEDNVNMLFNKIEDNCKECKDVVYVNKDGNVAAVVSRDVVKPTIGIVNKLENECHCLFDTLANFEETKGYIIINSEQDLRNLDESLNDVVLSVYEHEYRSFDGFTAALGVYLPNGYVYIIDAIKFREIIPQLNLLTCKVKKVVTSQWGIERLIRDFGQLGCYNNFNIQASNIFIDWRIRPFNKVMCCMICNDLVDAVEKLNKKLVMERHEPLPINEVEAFIEAFDIEETKKGLTDDLIKLRSYLAKKNDESPQFIMTDTQLYQIILNMPADVVEMEMLLNRMSSILRLHVGDFLIILRQKSKAFSIDNLKLKRVDGTPVATVDDFSENKYRNFED